jgi:hypothetical protein
VDKDHQKCCFHPKSRGCKTQWLRDDQVCRCSSATLRFSQGCSLATPVPGSTIQDWSPITLPQSNVAMGNLPEMEVWMGRLSYCCLPHVWMANKGYGYAPQVSIGIPKFCPWLQRVTPVVHSKPAAGFKEPHGPGPRDHLVITGWSGRGWITTSKGKRSSLARFQCWGYSLVSWLPI